MAQGRASINRSPRRFVSLSGIRGSEKIVCIWWGRRRIRWAAGTRRGSTSRCSGNLPPLPQEAAQCLVDLGGMEQAPPPEPVRGHVDHGGAEVAASQPALQVLLARGNPERQTEIDLETRNVDRKSVV